MSQFTLVTIRYILPPQHGYTSQYHGHEWIGLLASFSFHVNRPSHSWHKAISDPALETPKPKVMGVVKGKVMQSAQ